VVVDETSQDGSGHRLPLGDTGWSIWREALLRSTGFPAEGLARLTAPACGAVADAHLEGEASLEEFERCLAETGERISDAINEIAGETRLREAVTWQNPAMVDLLDSLLRAGRPITRNTKRRYREKQLSRIWQRYCAKAETIGFFGPSLWARFDETVDDMRSEPGPSLLARRQVFLEPWAVSVYGSTVPKRIDIRRWMAPAVMPHHFVEGGLVHRGDRRPLPVDDAETAALALCDGSRTAETVAAALRDDERSGVVSEEHAYALLDALVGRGLLRWDLNLPLGPETEAVLLQRIGAIADPGLRGQAMAGLEALWRARDGVARAAGDPEALAGALHALDAVFVELTGHPPRRRPGQTYAGRGLCYEDTTRDLDLVVGRRVLDDLAAPLGLVADVARWITSEVGRGCENVLAQRFDELRRSGVAPRLSDLWDTGIEVCLAEDSKVVAGVTSELAARTEHGLGLASNRSDRTELCFDSSALAGPFAELFAAERPGWSTARIHSPDLHVCAPSVEAVNAGDYTVVLGELHIASPTLCDRWCTWSREDPTDKLRLSVEDYVEPRLLPLLPAVWGRDAGRVVHIEDAPSDIYLGFARATGVEPRRTVPIGTIPVMATPGGLVGTLPDGTRRPLVEFFANFLSVAVVNLLRSALSGSHTPRVVIDRLVVFREQWRLSAGDLASLLAAKTEADQYLAARRLKAELGLPEQCFVKIATERKPVFVDLTGPLYIASLCTMLRAARDEGGDDAEVTVSEMLPRVDQTWLRDREGNRYFGELRVQLTDDKVARTA
jgi:Lantibiotic dehydratase, N terminus